MELRYTGKHRPKGVYEIRDDIAKELLKTDVWLLNSAEPDVGAVAVERKTKLKKPDTKEEK